jgi:multidrug efflux system membrane fusion protein
MRAGVWKRSLYIGVATLCIAAVAIYGFTRTVGHARDVPRGPAAAPVVVAIAQAQNFSVTVSGIGTAQASSTVDIHAQITGTIDKIGFTEGQTVHAGDLIAEIDPRPYRAALTQAEAMLARDQAQLTNAERDLARYLPLAEKGFASTQQLETQRSNVAQMTALVKNDEAAIEKAKTDLSYTRITAPMDGVTGIRGIDAGNIVHPTDTTPIVTITQIEPIAVVFTLPAQNLGTIQARMAASTLTADAFDQDNKEQLGHGKLAVVDNQIDPKTGTVRMKAMFPNTGHKLWPGAFVNIRLETDVRPDAVTVPSVAVQHSPDGVFAFVVTPEGTVERRALTLGDVNGDVAMIAKGISAGEKVVADGYARLQDGAKVRIVERGAEKNEKPGA